MPPDKPPASLWFPVLTRVVLCAAVGVAISAVFWAGTLVHEGKCVPAALRGEVEDAIGRFQALTAIGGLVGAAVGIVYALTTAEARKRP